MGYLKQGFRLLVQNRIVVIGTGQQYVFERILGTAAREKVQAYPGSSSAVSSLLFGELYGEAWTTVSYTPIVLCSSSGHEGVKAVLLRVLPISVKHNGLRSELRRIIDVEDVPQRSQQSAVAVRYDVAPNFYPV